MKNKILLIILFSFLFYPSGVSYAQNIVGEKTEEIFKAQIVEIIEYKNTTINDGGSLIQQKLKLEGLERKWEGREIIFDGTEYDVISSPEYKLGDKVLVNYSLDVQGNDMFYVIGFVRQGGIYWIAFLFAIIVIAIGRFKGLRALIVLALTFLVILKFIIPKILAGSNPLLITIVGSLFILILAIYITE